MTSNCYLHFHAVRTEHPVDLFDLSIGSKKRRVRLGLHDRFWDGMARIPAGSARPSGAKRACHLY